MKKIKNQFESLIVESLIDCYKESVDIFYSKGYAEKFKTCADTLFNGLAHNKKQIYTAEDIKYLDGYYIFGFGTNSVVHFHVKECPGWLFGVWWRIPEIYKNDLGEDALPEYVEGDFFAQYEDAINKFKPSYSSIISSFSIVPDSNHEPDLLSIIGDLNFIHNDPELAFCRDYLGWDYNTEYHTREEAKAKFDEYILWKSNKDLHEKECDNKMIEFAKNELLPQFNNSELFDLGENWCPRYVIVAPLETNKEEFDEAGYYSVFEDGSELEDKFKQLKKECNDISDLYQFIWFNPVGESVHIYNKKGEIN